MMEAAFAEVEAKRFHDALSLMKSALALTSEDPDSHHNIAEVCRLAGEAEQAKFHYSEALKLSPDNPDAYHGLADLLVAEENWTEANENIAKARSLRPDDPEILNLAGIILEKEGQTFEARAALKRAVQLAPNFADALCNLGALNYATKHYAEAIDSFNSAASLRSLNEQQLTDLFNAHLRQDQGAEALEVAEQLMRISAKKHKALVARASAHRSVGDFEAAEKDYRAAIAKSPDCAMAYHDLGTMKKLDEQDLAKLEQLAGRSDLAADTEVNLQYAIYFARNAQKKHASAFQALKAGNDILAQDRPVDVAQMAEQTGRALDVFSNDFFGARPEFGLDREGPVFIIGMPRSGTTLTERILAAHPDIHGGGERRNIPHILETLKDYPEEITEQSGDWVQEYGEIVFASMFEDANGAKFATDKLPGNYGPLGLIALILPKAKIIYCKRNPIDNCLSCYEQQFGDGLRYSFSFEGLAAAYKQHERYMQHWFDVCPIPIHTVEYEELATNPEPVSRSMIEYIGLEWNEACLKPESVGNSIATASVWQARQPINTSSVDRWRRYGTELEPLIKALE